MRQAHGLWWQHLVRLSGPRDTGVHRPRRVFAMALAVAVSINLAWGASSPEWTRISVESDDIIYMNVASVDRTYVVDHGVREVATATAIFLDDKPNIGPDMCMRQLAVMGAKCTPSMRSPFASTVWRTKYDCQRNLARGLGLRSYLGHMGQGNIVPSFSEESPMTWHAVLSGTMSFQRMGLACNGLPYGVAAAK